MQCPECGSENLYDNRRENDERIARGEKPRPDWKCKDCGHVVWRPKGQAARKPAAPVKQGFTSGPRLPGEEPEQEQPREAPADAEAKAKVLGRLIKMHRLIAQEVLKDELPLYGTAQLGATPEVIQKGIDTIFIAAVGAGLYK